ncbi:kinase-like protein [Panus rudis PR-1116 ss-1]|nr:kinase-like protein [Panus rudis PR-1116 ss-1]
MAPTLGPELPAFHPRGRDILPARKSSSTLSTQKARDISSRSLSRETSASSIPFNDSEVDVVRVEGLRHSEGRLDARRYKTDSFAETLLTIIRSLHVPCWNSKRITSQSLKIQKVSGSLTNAVFFVSCPSIPQTPILLLRIYGPSSGSMISRPRELQTLHVLSSQYHIGPRVYGTFENGRIEEYFDSSALTHDDLRNPQISAWIGARMAELHQVDIAAIGGDSTEGERGGEIGAKKNFQDWLLPAREVLALPSVPDSVRKELDLDALEAEWKEYMTWLDDQEKEIGQSRRVFAHNDTQYGNLLRLNSTLPGIPEHRQIIVVDFEYASPNTAAFDIANHFHEWTANYHGPTPHLLDPSKYPTLEQRRNFYRAYIRHYGSSISPQLSPSTTPDGDSLEAQLDLLDRLVKIWSPSSHAMWAVWGIVQAREALEGKDGESAEFDYISYARCRMEGFRREYRALMSGSQ